MIQAPNIGKSKLIIVATLMLLPLALQATILPHYIVDITTIECAEAHGFGIMWGYLGGKPPPRNERWRIGVTVPAVISGRANEEAEFVYSSEDENLFIPVGNSWGPRSARRHYDLNGTYGLLTDSQLRVKYEGRWIFILHFSALDKSLRRRGNDSIGIPLRRSVELIDSLEGCEQHGDTPWIRPGGPKRESPDVQ